jgi:hypothetical protein
MDADQPPVSRDELRRHLVQLKRELESAGQLDNSTRALLEEVAGDIEQALHEDTLQPSSMSERLEASALEFEADHPALARVLREVTDALAKLGV